MLKPAILLLTVALAAAAQDAPGMDCQPRTLVRYQPGPNFKNVQQFVPGHLKTIAGLLKDGSLLFAGPAEDGSAMGVFKSTNQAEVEKMVKEDPFVVNGVLTYKMIGWRHCVAPKS